jgi:hypothetical protein
VVYGLHLQGVIAECFMSTDRNHGVDFECILFTTCVFSLVCTKREQTNVTVGSIIQKTTI